MYYDYVPEYNILFSNDKFPINKRPSVCSAAFILSYMGYLYTEKRGCTETFLGESLGCIGIDKIKFREYLEDKTLITELGVLRAWKYIFNNLNNTEDSQGLLYKINYFYRIIIKEQERCINNFKNTYSSLMTNSLLEYLDNPAFQFFRTYYFFIKEKDYFENSLKEYGFCEIYTKFNDKYSISIEDYIEGIYIISMCACEANFRGIKDTKDLCKYNFLICCDKNSNKKFEQVLQILSFNYEEAKQWSNQTCGNDMDFSLFQEKPLYKISDNYYLPITRKFIDDQIFNSLIYKIRGLYGEDDDRFWTILGKMFEQYVIYISQETCSKTRRTYKIIPEFKYGVRKNKTDSSDLYIVEGNNVCVIELKAARPVNSIYKYDNRNELEKSIEKVIIKPLKQAIKRTQEIVGRGEKDELTRDKNFYFLAITLKNFPIDYNDYSEFKNCINSATIKIRGINKLSIEEFELLCGAMGQENESLFHFLREYSEKMPDNCSFKNYINQYVKGCPKPFFEELEKDVQRFIDKISLYNKEYEG